MYILTELKFTLAEFAKECMKITRSYFTMLSSCGWGIFEKSKHKVKAVHKTACIVDYLVINS